ncbi:hypothetical protein U1Q18_007494, partial [Sarracenia purpurea var. burkii]
MAEFSVVSDYDEKGAIEVVGKMVSSGLVPFQKDLRLQDEDDEVEEKDCIVDSFKRYQFGKERLTVKEAGRISIVGLDMQPRG